ncbi:ETT1 [Candida pseudojiufengensis]|uniref:ETT1 n=1 Tax=Candida pseudojiufengensis TaxID=497109 RepID=UPI0022257E39|nr:ETT1 [Candida pseudojiufengensis]KAI5960180.1 ETT1 [Candida pseudojiufengensis]
MAKRTLGLGKAAKAKKQKIESSSTNPETSTNQTEPEQNSNELTIELPKDIDSTNDENEEIIELKGLYKTYLDSERDNELILNGIIHECDRILRNYNSAENSENKIIPSTFYKIYAFSLSELSKFYNNDLKKVSDFFEESLNRIEDGLRKFPKDIELLFIKFKILINQIILQYISQLNINSTSIKDIDVEEIEINLKEEIDYALTYYDEAETKALEDGDYKIFNNDEICEILENFDDLLEIIDNFGKEEEEEEEEEEYEGEEKKQKRAKSKGDEDEDENSDSDSEEIELSESHPLYPLKTTDKYKKWWQNHTNKYLEILNKLKSPSFKIQKRLNERLGQSYLKESEFTTNIYLTLKFNDDYSGIEELEGLTAEESRELSIELIEKAIYHLTPKTQEDDEDPENWVNVAESKILLGNLYDINSKEQEKNYLEAEILLRAANNSTNGKYQDVLDNLLAKDD